MDIKWLEEEFLDLINIGIALTSEHETDKLLEKIVTEARKFTHCDAGSLYIKEENNTLKFVVAQNDTLDKRIGHDLRKASFTPFTLPLDKKSVAGYVAVTGQTLNIDDVYHIPFESEFQFNDDFDIRNNYRTKSMLVIPLIDVESKVIGALQLINSLNENKEAVPFDPFYVRFVHSLASQASVAIKNAQLNFELKRAHLSTIYRLAVAGEYHENETGKHVKRISIFSEIIAINLKLAKDEIETIKSSSLMHDIGKIAIPDAILLKPGKLTPEERKIMETHTTKGSEILNDPSSPFLVAAQVVAVTHHEKFDGTGYPNKLKGDQIPLSGRIVALADVFDALCSKRCYKEAFPLDKVVEILKEERGKHFDPIVIDAFFKSFEKILYMWEKYRD